MALVLLGLFVAGFVALVASGEWIGPLIGARPGDTSAALLYALLVVAMGALLGYLEAKVRRRG